MERDWFEAWRDGVRADVARFLDGFEARFGFPPGEHVVSDPTPASIPGGLPADLVVFFEVVGEVRLPDVANGYWITPPTPADHGWPHTLTDGRRITVFGSDGGGALFALAGTPVLRLSGGAELNGVYDAEAAIVIAADLEQFLTLLKAEIEQRPGGS